jgi:hypothetical protein
MRRLGLTAVLKAHQPTVAAAWVAEVLGFCGEEGGGVDGEEFRTYMTEEAGRCRLTVSEPVLKAPMVSALDTMIW